MFQAEHADAAVHQDSAQIHHGLGEKHCAGSGIVAAAEFLQEAGAGVRAQHDVGVEHDQQGLEIAGAGGCHEGVHYPALRSQVHRL